MIRTYESVLDSIGNTPLVRVPDSDFKGAVYAKLEYLNPGGSLKDRSALYMVAHAEKTGQLVKGGTIVEASSGNQGIALAMIGAVKGYRVIITVPDKTSVEKVATLRAYGAEVYVCPTVADLHDPLGYHAMAERLLEEIPGAYMPNQYVNKLNAEAHYNLTGPEIWDQIGDRLTHLFVGLGTCGTASGIGKYLKEKNPAIKIIGVDAAGSALSSKVPFAYTIEGIGVDSLDGNYNPDVIDEVIAIEDADAYEMTRNLGRTYGLMGGLSSGAVMHAYKLYKDKLDKDSVSVVMFGDSGRAYIHKVFVNK